MKETKLKEGWLAALDHLKEYCITGILNSNPLVITNEILFDNAGIINDLHLTSK